MLSPSEGQVAHALLTRSPLKVIANFPFDLHVLGTPPAFVLSQDQTLRNIIYEERLALVLTKLLIFCDPFQTFRFEPRLTHPTSLLFSSQGPGLSRLSAATHL